MTNSVLWSLILSLLRIIKNRVSDMQVGISSRVSVAEFAQKITVQLSAISIIMTINVERSHYVNNGCCVDAEFNWLEY